ncbi:hypothetical protein [Pseudotamlana carrageenivorans]|uniref:Lipopolysaccharide biosynthesis protein n=1 Tax=Pseudotamlana carrageenivorans TaxID=2069432 RepID=A0A2I7SDL5_9FLAO|nr:hypothetical protein [Tamlana carrageenivorans]AUS03987.1 hypothetical protein C1A40_00130 [Tamlana carrageenivorans]
MKLVKKITIISTSPLGYVDYLIENLRTNSNVDVTYIDYLSFKYKYKSIFDKLKNFVNKIVFKTNIKKDYKSNCLMAKLNSIPKQDVILIIRPDRLSVKDIIKMRAYTKELNAFYYDSTTKVPVQIDLISLFDKVFSYEKQDVKVYDLNFITNYIYDFQEYVPIVERPKVFNVTSFDERFQDLVHVADYFKSEDIDYSILISKKNAKPHPLVTIFSGFMSLNDVKTNILQATIVLDIQKNDQKGLSFRVFEALGYHKKLITTNADIVNYDFYNPNNIFVLDLKNIEIPRSFFETPYQEIPTQILYKYTLNGWIETVLGIQAKRLNN